LPPQAALGVRQLAAAFSAVPIDRRGRRSHTSAGGWLPVFRWPFLRDRGYRGEKAAASCRTPKEASPHAACSGRPLCPVRRRRSHPLHPV